MDYTPVVVDLGRSPYPLASAEPFDFLVDVWFRISTSGPAEDAQREWNTYATGLLKPGGTIVHVGSPTVSSSDHEAGLWPASIRWSTMSTESEVRMVGRKPD